MAATPDLPYVATGDNLTSAQWNSWVVGNIREIWKGQAAGDIDYYESATTKARLAGGVSNAYKTLKQNATGSALVWGSETTQFTSAQGNTSWDGDNHSAGTTTVTVNSFNTNLPNSARAVMVVVSAKWAAAGGGNSITIKPTGGYGNCLTVRSQAAGIFQDGAAIVPLNSSGQFDVVIAGAACDVYIEVWGYIR